MVSENSKHPIWCKKERKAAQLQTPGQSRYRLWINKALNALSLPQNSQLLF